MNVSLSPELEAMVCEKVESGKFASASEVIGEALRIMEREEKRRILIEAIQKGFEQLERGEGIEFTSTTMAESLERAKANLAAGHQVSDLVKP